MYVCKFMVKCSDENEDIMFINQMIWVWLFYFRFKFYSNWGKKESFRSLMIMFVIIFWIIAKKLLLKNIHKKLILI